MFHTPGDVRWFKASAAVRTVDKVLKIISMMDHVLMHFILSVYAASGDMDQMWSPWSHQRTCWYSWYVYVL